MRRVGDSDPLSEFSGSASGSPFVTVMCSYRELAKFCKHISKIIRKVGHQLGVLNRQNNTLSISSKMCLYNSFVMSYYTFYSVIWQNCYESNKLRLERLNLRALYNQRVPPRGDDDYGLILSYRTLPYKFCKAVNGKLPV